MNVALLVLLAIPPKAKARLVPLTLLVRFAEPLAKMNKASVVFAAVAESPRLNQMLGAIRLTLPVMFTVPVETKLFAAVLATSISPEVMLALPVMFSVVLPLFTKPATNKPGPLAVLRLMLPLVVSVKLLLPATVKREEVAEPLLRSILPFRIILPLPVVVRLLPLPVTSPPDCKLPEDTLSVTVEELFKATAPVPRFKVRLPP